MSAPAIAAVRRNALRNLIPPPKQHLSEWAQTHLVLPEGSSALPGPIRLWPFQVEIADSIGDPAVERVTVQKSVRIGYSTLLAAAIGSYIANDPAPILLLMPTESDARDVVVSDLEPLFAASPCLAGLTSSEADETGRNTLLSRRFPGGSLKIVAARAPRNLRRHNVRVLLCDEVDGMESGPEGSPLVLAERRTLSFPNRKIVVGSTPVHEETSHVCRSYALSDKRVFEVPCPSCGAFTEIMWQHIEWQEGKPETAAFRCPHCRDLIDERQKLGMITSGRWRATAPEVVGHHGYRLNALVSPHHNASWGRLAAEFIAAKKSPDTLQVFVNTILGEPWRDQGGEELDPNALGSGAEDFGLLSIPAECLLISAGCDVQVDRLEITFIGHGRDGAAYVLAHQVVWGRATDDTTWQELDEVLKSRWKHPLGGTIGVDSCAVDAGDGNVTDIVQGFCRPRFGRKIVAVKGAAGFARPAIERSHSKGATLFICGVDTLKARIHAMIAHGNLHFSRDLDGRYFEELASERLVTRYVRGAPVRRWERIVGRRAECLDATAYALAVKGILSIPLDRREMELSSPAAPKVMIPTVIPSKWLNR